MSIHCFLYAHWETCMKSFRLVVMTTLKVDSTSGFLLEKCKISQAWWYTPLISVTVRCKEETPEVKGQCQKLRVPGQPGLCNSLSELSLLQKANTHKQNWLCMWLCNYEYTKDSLIVLFKMCESGIWKNGSAVQSTCCSYRGPGFSSSTSHGDSQPSINPVPEDPAPSASLGTYIPVSYKPFRGKTPMHNKLN